MNHTEFVNAYGARSIRIEIDPVSAARYLSARLLLPLVMMPVLGVGVALAMTGWIWSGLSIVGIGIIVPRLLKRSAPHFILTQALQEESFYQEVTSANILRVLPRP
jgi:hypothetical protein